MTADAIVLEHVHVTYPGAATEALNDICLRVPSGQHLCILGGNGSGKSTLLQLVNVLAIPTAGRAVIHGMDTSDPCRTLAIRSRTASVFQHPEDQMVTSVVADDVAFGPENLCTPSRRSRNASTPPSPPSTWTNARRATPPIYPADRCSAWRLPGHSQ